MTYRLHLPLISALALITAACGREPEAAAPTDGASMDARYPDALATGMGDASGDAAIAGSKTGTFLADVMKGNNGEIRLGQLAAQKGSTGAVRNYGQMLAKDHGKSGMEFSAVASTLGMSPTKETTPEADATYARLQSLSGTAFDKEFARVAVAEHRKHITMFEGQAASGDSSEVTALAKKTLPTLKRHLEMAEKLVSD